MVYFIVFLMIDLIAWVLLFRFFLSPRKTKRPQPPQRGSDDSDDGLTLSDVPVLDLPPGVTLPISDKDLVEVV